MYEEQTATQPVNDLIFIIINMISINRNQIGSTLIKSELICKGYIRMNFIATFALSLGIML